MPNPKKNLLFILTDQWRAQATGYSGNPHVKTPHLDALCRESLNLPNAVSGIPVCTPARATLLTGKYPHEHGLFLNDAPLDPTLPTLGKALLNADYATGWIGKWHVDGHGRSDFIPVERRHGFEYWKTLECTHDYWNSKYYDHDEIEPMVWVGYDAAAQTRDAIRTMADRTASERPFSLFLSLGPPHSPYQTAPDEFKALYDWKDIPAPPNMISGIGSPEQARKDLAGYYAHCTALDDCVGNLVKALKSLDLWDNTVLVFTSDHGDMVGSKSMYDKQCPFDESIRIPFLIRDPEMPETHGTANPTVLNLIDLYPTLGTMLGFNTPDDLHGRDMAGHLRNGTKPGDNAALCAAYHTFGNWPRQTANHPEFYRSREYRGLRNERFTYMEDLNGPWMLFDNEADPYQLENLVGSVDHNDLQTAMAERLKARLAAVGDEFKPGMDMVREWGYEVNEGGTIAVRW